MNLRVWTAEEVAKLHRQVEQRRQQQARDYLAELVVAFGLAILWWAAIIAIINCLTLIEAN
jgi:fatty acid desaturase